METSKIKGATRCVGEAQGFLPLYIRDELQDFGSDFGVVPTMTVEFKPSPAELAKLAAGEPFKLQLWGTNWPPCLLYVGEDIEGMTAGNG